MIAIVKELSFLAGLANSHWSGSRIAVSKAWSLGTLKHIDIKR